MTSTPAATRFSRPRFALLVLAGVYPLITDLSADRGLANLAAHAGYRAGDGVDHDLGADPGQMFRRFLNPTQ